jgi:hypothetical protein
MLSAEQIEKNYKTLLAQVEKIASPRKEAVLKMLDNLGERLMLCPASSRKGYHRSEPGGLVDHSLRVLLTAMKLNKSMGWKLSEESLIISALFHDFGKIGNVDTDYYIEAEGWQKKKGELYQTNPSIQYMEVPLRSVFLLQHFGVTLTQDEMLAITLNDGFVVEANKPYCLKEPKLATCTWMADYIATMAEKEEEAEEILQLEAAKAKAKTEED